MIKLDHKSEMNSPSMEKRPKFKQYLHETIGLSRSNAWMIKNGKSKQLNPGDSEVQLWSLQLARQPPTVLWRSNFSCNVLLEDPVPAHSSDKAAAFLHPFCEQWSICRQEPISQSRSPHRPFPFCPEIFLKLVRHQWLPSVRPCPSETFPWWSDVVQWRGYDAQKECLQRPLSIDASVRRSESIQYIFQKYSSIGSQAAKLQTENK